MKIRRLLPILAAVGTVSSHAAISITSTSFTYSQTFDTLASSGTGNAWTNDTTLSGWHLFRQPSPGTAMTAYNAGTGSSNAGAIYSFGTAAGDRALGGLGSGGTVFGSPSNGSVAAWIAVCFTNNTATPVKSITVGFNGEQWRDGGATTPNAQTMVLEYGFGSSFTTVPLWTAPGGLFDWTSPVFSNTGTGAAVDGNVAGLVSNRGGTLSSLNWAVGETLWIRWIERNDVGNDHGLAIDNFQITAVTPVPEPGALILSSVASLGLLIRRRR